MLAKSSTTTLFNSNLTIPDYKNAIDVMAAVYTAPENGYIIVQLRANGNNQGCSINNVTVCQMYAYTVNGQPITIHTVPIAKGDIAKILSEDNNSDTKITKFIPCKTL